MSDTSSNQILFTEYRDHAVITFNRPEKLNCLSRALMDDFESKLVKVREESVINVLILAGAGGIFSAGADLSEVSALTPQVAFDFSRKGQRLLASIGESAPVTIAAIDGHCIGGGLDIAMSCDMRFASVRSTFQHPGALRGIITGWGGTQRMPRLIGVDAARRLLLSAERIDAGEALRIGLINSIEKDPLNHALQLAQKISAGFTRNDLLSIRAELA